MTVSWKSADLKRAIKAATEMGLVVSSIRFPREGGFVLHFGQGGAEPTTNEWDEVFDDT